MTAVRSWRGSTCRCGGCRSSSATCPETQTRCGGQDTAVRRRQRRVAGRPASPRHPTAIVSSDGEESVRRVLGQRRSHLPLQCGAAIFGSTASFGVARHFRIKPRTPSASATRSATSRPRAIRRHGFRRSRLGLCVSRALQAAGQRICSIRSRRSRNGSRPAATAQALMACKLE